MCLSQEVITLKTFTFKKQTAQSKYPKTQYKKVKYRLLTIQIGTYIKQQKKENKETLIIRYHIPQQIAQKNTIRLQKNRQSAKKARQRKKIYVKLLEQQQKRLNDVLQKTQNVQKISSQYVQLLSNRKKQVTNKEIKHIRKASQNDIDKIPTKNVFIKKETQKLQDKISLLKQIVQQLTQLSKYAYWKHKKPLDANQNENQQAMNAEQDFFNIQEVLADIEVVQMKNQNYDLNLDDLLNVDYQDDDYNQQKQKYDIKSLITDQYDIVQRYKM